MPVQYAFEMVDQGRVDVPDRRRFFHTDINNEGQVLYLKFLGGNREQLRLNDVTVEDIDSSTQGFGRGRQVNDLGHVVFQTGTKVDNRISVTEIRLWSGLVGAPIMRLGDAVPGNGALITELGFPDINNGGTIVCWAKVSEGAADREVILAWKEGNLFIVADTANSTYSTFTDATINDKGLVVFAAEGQEIGYLLSTVGSELMVIETTETAGVTGIGSRFAVNNFGTIAFRGQMLEEPRMQGIFLANGNIPNCGVTTLFREDVLVDGKIQFFGENVENPFRIDPGINSNGTVVFYGVFHDVRQPPPPEPYPVFGGILTSNDTNQPVFRTTGGYEPVSPPIHFGGVDYDAQAIEVTGGINDRGEIAFWFGGWGVSPFVVRAVPSS